MQVSGTCCVPSWLACCGTRSCRQPGNAYGCDQLVREERQALQAGEFTKQEQAGLWEGTAVGAQLYHLAVPIGATEACARGAVQ